MADALPLASPYPTTGLPPTKVDVTISSQTADPDRTLRVQHAETYPLEVWYFLACLIFLASFINFTGIALGYYRDRRQRRRFRRTSNEGPEPPLRSDSIDWLRLPLAVGDTFRALSFRWTVPVGRSYTINFVEVLLTAVYIAICLAWSLINTTSTKGVKFDPHYYANITGNIASIQFPLIVALGMKNNIISFLTGVSFDKLIYLHGMASRVLVVLVWLHAGGRIQLGLEGKVAITVPVVQAGVLAGVALTLLSIVSIRPIRDKAYEFFLIVHLVLALICIFSAYFHAASFNFGQFVWPAILLWALDRFLRLLRVAVSTITRKKPTSSKAKPNSPVTVTAKPTLELLSAHFIRLTVPAPRFFYWRPGQSVYLTFPGVTFSPFEAHPFTISTINTGSGQSDLRFFIRVHKGATKRLFDSIERERDVKVLLDGPYSSPPLLVGYDTVLLVAGGSGISFTLPLFLDLIQRSKLSGCACRRLTFAWTVRNLGHVSWIQSELFNALQDIPDEALDDDTNSVLDEKAEQEKDARDAMSVTVCGTHALASAVRKAVRYPRMSDILKGGPTVSLHVEAFGSN
ncbi:Ferric/cupric reductase transmembrane component 1 [Leucoagaricus sp. SymC.cos]|nr:Ferric/cupric reductase transmembrane component 1 [Leucoagaricus sp. SymC.cos]